MHDWIELPFKDIIKNGNVSYGIVQPGSNDVSENSIPILRINNFKNRRLVINDIFYVHKDIECKYARTRLNGSELLITVVGTIGQCIVAPQKLKGWNVARAIAVAQVKDNFNKYFIASQFEDEYIKFQIYGSMNDTVQPTLNLKELKEIKFRIPPLAEQRAIAGVLGSLDDKIDLLQRQNSTLEAMAETLFRQWFIEEAQEDWEEKTLGEFFPIKTGKKDANFSSIDGEYPFFTCSKQASKASNYSFEGSAILLAGNGDFNVKRYIGKFEAYQRTYVLMPYETKFFNFLFVLVKYFLQDITGGYRGSVINFITKGMISNFKISLPKNDFSLKLEKFDMIFYKIDYNQQQIRTLEKLRDTLLPKLMSGEVRVRVDG